MQRSIRTQLLFWILVPLLLLSVVSAVVTYSRALHMSETIYDEMLLNSSDSVIARTLIIRDLLRTCFSKTALLVFRHNGRDDFYFKITDSDGNFLVGDEFVPSASTSISSGPEYKYGVINGAQVRVCSVPFEPHVVQQDPMPPRTPNFVRIYTAAYHNPSTKSPHLIVHVAETCHARTAVAHQVLVTTLVLEALLGIGGGVAVWFGIGRGLLPLRQIQEAIAKRTPGDLDELQIPHPPKEVWSLIETINTVLTLLRKHIEEQATFVSNAAHELRTPLAGLKTYVDLGKKHASTTRETDLFVNLNEGVGRMSNLVNKLLALAKAESSVAVTKMNQRLDLNDIVIESLLSLRAKAESKKISVEFNASAEPSMIFGDHQGLLELIDNLILNAIVFTPVGGRLTISTTFCDGHAVLIVEDNGPGIPESERVKVFQRFYRILGNGAEGSGLGLAIVKTIADSHMAAVSISSSPSLGGCRIVVDFKDNKFLQNSLPAVSSGNL